MAKPYSDDFRQKEMQAIEWEGLKKSEASQLFNSSRNPINLWFQRQAESGDVKAKPRQAAQQNGKITDGEKLRAFVQEHRDKTQAEMAQLWAGEISQRRISRALQKSGHTRKKTPRGILNAMKPKERT